MWLHNIMRGLQSDVSRCSRLLPAYGSLEVPVNQVCSSPNICSTSSLAGQGLQLRLFELLREIGSPALGQRRTLQSAAHLLQILVVAQV